MKTDTNLYFKQNRRCILSEIKYWFISRRRELQYGPIWTEIGEAKVWGGENVLQEEDRVNLTWMK